MDGRVRALGNVFITRLWCSLNYEDVYLPLCNQSEGIKVAIFSLKSKRWAGMVGWMTIGVLG